MKTDSVPVSSVLHKKMQQLVMPPFLGWTGPLNVPGYSVYEYKAAGGPTGGEWIQPVGGGSSIKSQPSANDVNILWGQGADVERAVYQANAEYSWGLNVNVVKVTVTTSTISRIAGAAAAGAAAYSNGTVDSKYAAVTSPGNVTFGASVTVQGAGASGLLGLKFVNIGFIQNLDAATASNASFANGKKRTSSTQGLTSTLDTWDGSISPWFDTTNGITNGLWTPSTNNATHAFQVTDQPSLWIPVRDDDTPAGALTTAVNVEWSFTMYLAVATTEAKNDSEKVFAQKLKGNWSINYDGTVAGAAYTPTAVNAMTVPASGTFAAPQNNGDIVPKTSGTIFNTEIHKIIWSPPI